MSATLPDIVQWSFQVFKDRLRLFKWSRKLTAIHVHATWNPTKQNWIDEVKSKGSGVQLVKNMRAYHVNVKRWLDIGQHLTIGADGTLWSGRNWNWAPASDPGDNGTSLTGPFMFDMVGNFDLGHEQLEGKQRVTAIGVIVALQEFASLKNADVKFHRQLGSHKTCPGSGISYEAFMEEVDAWRVRL